MGEVGLQFFHSGDVAESVAVALLDFDVNLVGAVLTAALSPLSGFCLSAGGSLGLRTLGFSLAVEIRQQLRDVAIPVAISHGESFSQYDLGAFAGFYVIQVQGIFLSEILEECGLSATLHAFRELHDPRSLAGKHTIEYGTGREDVALFIKGADERLVGAVEDIKIRGVEGGLAVACHADMSQVYQLWHTVGSAREHDVAGSDVIMEEGRGLLVQIL